VLRRPLHGGLPETARHGGHQEVTAARHEDEAAGVLPPGEGEHEQAAPDTRATRSEPQPQHPARFH
jgi:hypothetical protein